MTKRDEMLLDITINYAGDLRKAFADALIVDKKVTITGRVAALLDMIEDARQHGFTWADIAERLAVVGITQNDRKPLTVGGLYQIVRRLQQRQQKPASAKALFKTVAPASPPPASRPSPHPPPSRPTQTPEAGVGATADDLALFSEIEAMLAQPSGQKPTPSIDEFLAEKKNGKSGS